MSYKCPHCGWLTEQLRNRLIPPHPVRGYRDGMICPGSNQNPRNAESDKRPRTQAILWAVLVLACYALGWFAAYRIGYDAGRTVSAKEAYGNHR